MGTNKVIRLWDIFYAELFGIENQQQGIRPVLVFSNDMNNRYSPTIQVIPLSSELKKLCVHVTIEGCGLKFPSDALIEQLTTINKTQFKDKIGRLSSHYIPSIYEAADIQSGRIQPSRREDPFMEA